MEKDYYCCLLEPDITDTSKTIKSTGRESIPGLMGTLMMETGSIIRGKALVITNGIMEILTKANGMIVKDKVKELKFGLTMMCMREIGTRMKE
jgi:hypothetical protein